MSFANLIKPKTTTTEGAASSMKPIAKPNLSSLVKPNLNAGVTPKATGGIALKIPKMDLSPKTVEATKVETTVEENTEVVTEPVVENIVVEEIVAVENTEEVAAEETTNTPVEEQAQEEAKEDAKQIEEEKVEESVEAVEEPVAEIKEEAETKKETPKAKKASGSKKTASSKEVSGKESFLTSEEFEILEAEMNLVAFDEEFEERKEYLVELANAIVIQSDMSTSQVLEAIAQLDELNREVWVEYFQYKTKFTNLTAVKPEGKIERIKRVNRTGKNDSDREKNGIAACQNYEAFNGSQVNLMSYQEILRYRYNFFQSIFDYINTKRQMLITVQACIKTESSL